MWHPHDDLCKGVGSCGVYQVCVRIDCGGLRYGLGLFLYRPGYFNVVMGVCHACQVPAVFVIVPSQLWIGSLTPRPFVLVIVVISPSWGTFMLSIAK